MTYKDIKETAEEVNWIYNAYQDASFFYQYEYGKNIVVPFVFTQLGTNGIIYDEFLMYLVIKKLELIKETIKNNGENYSKERKKIANFIDEIGKMHLDKDYKLETEKKEEIRKFIENNSEFIINLFKKIIDNKNNYTNHNISLNKKDIKIYKMEAIGDEKRGNTDNKNNIPDMSAFYYIVNVPDNIEERYSLESQLIKEIEFLDDKFKEYMKVLIRKLNSTRVPSGIIQRYLLKHSFVFDRMVIAESNGQILYSCKIKNFMKRYSDDDVYKNGLEKYIEYSYSKEKKKLSKEEKEKLMSDTKIKSVYDKLYDNYYLKVKEYSEEYYKKYFNNVYRNYSAFYKEHYKTTIIPSDIKYERFKEGDKHLFNIEEIKIFPKYMVERIIYIAENQQDAERLEKKVEKMARSLYDSDKEFKEYILSIIEKERPNNQKYLNYGNIFIYYNYYKENTKFDKILRDALENKDSKQGIKFLYDVFSGVVALGLFLKEKNAIPFLLVYDDKDRAIDININSQDSNVSANEKYTIEFFTYLDSLLNIFSEFPYQLFRKSNINEEEKYLAKNFFLSSLKKNKISKFKIKLEMGLKDISLKGLIIQDKCTNNVNPDNVEYEINRKHRIIDIYYFEYKSTEKDNIMELKLEYLTNMAYLAKRGIDKYTAKKLEKIKKDYQLSFKNDFIIGISQYLHKEDFENLIFEMFNETIEDKQFNYVKYSDEIPFIRHININKINKDKEEKAYFIYKESAGNLKTLFNEIMENKGDIGNLFSIIYSPAVPKRNDDKKGKGNRLYIKNFEYQNSYGTLYLPYHNQSLSAYIEQIIFALHIFSSESFRSPYSKLKKELVLNKSIFIRRGDKNNKYLFKSFISVIETEMLYTFNQVFKWNLFENSIQ